MQWTRRPISNDDYVLATAQKQTPDDAAYPCGCSFLRCLCDTVVMGGSVQKGGPIDRKVFGSTGQYVTRPMNNGEYCANVSQIVGRTNSKNMDMEAMKALEMCGDEATRAVAKAALAVPTFCRVLHALNIMEHPDLV